MDRRSRRKPWLTIEEVERRELLSLVTDLMASNRQAVISSLRARDQQAQVSSSFAAGGTLTGQSPGASVATSSGGFVPSTTSIAVPQNQGPQGINLVLAPVGKPTLHQLRRQLFQATFIGPYTIGPGQFDSEAIQVFLRGSGRATSMLHCDIQARIVVAQDPSIQNSGASVIFDRNLNSNSALGFNLAAPHQSVDSHGRPNHFDSVSLDINSSSGVYVEGYSQGVLDIKYIPNGKRTPGVIEQGTAVIRIQAQIYSPNVAFILRNSDINP
jgi:hypothetical protein